MVTTDVPVGANREYNLRNGFEIPFHLNLANMIDGVLHPRWLIDVFLRTLLDSGVPRFQNVDTNVGGRIIAKDLGQFRARRDALDWSDLRWLREIWPHKLFIKGMLHADDARLAADIRRRRHFRFQPRRAPARRRACRRSTALPEIARCGRRPHRRSCSTAASGAAPTSSRRWRWAPTWRSSAARRSTASRRAGEAGALHALELLKSEVDRVHGAARLPDGSGRSSEYANS